MSVSAHPSESRRTHLAVLALCMVAAVVHQAVHWDWVIEDAAICFAYARNIAAGEGAVPFPGGERIEGFSNPTWVALLTLFHALGLDGWSTSKPLGMLFGAGAVAISWQIAREALPDHRGPGALIAPLLLALNAQFALWSASGLETSLFGFLLALGLWRAPIEAERGGVPWSAGWFLLVAWTRPEGAVYAAIGGSWFALTAFRAQRGIRPTLLWAGAFGLPFALLEGLRLAYFAWPLPNTYYAKIHSPMAAIVDWTGVGWSQLRSWSDRVWHGFLVPVYALGLTGPRGWRPAAAVGLLAVVGALVSWPGPEVLRALSWWPELPSPPDAWVAARCLGLLGLLAVVPFFSIGTAGGAWRGLCGHALAFGIAFSVSSDGDWMGGFRWMSLVAVPGSVVLAVGMVEGIDALERRLGSGPSGAWGAPGWLAASFATGLMIPPNFSMTRDHRFWNFDVTPQMVKPRVDYLRWVARRTFHEGPIRHLEIDQGAFLWFAPEFRQHDLALLIDVPLAHHWWQQRPFVREYVFDEMRPTFTNIGIRNRWTRRTGLHEYPEWDERYFELPGYPNRHGLPYIGIFALRELVMDPAPVRRPERRTAFAADWVVEGFAQPVPWESGGSGYLEVPVSTSRPRKRTDDAKLIAFVHREGTVHSWQLPLGYDLLQLWKWAPGEVFRGRHAVPLPELEPGRWDLGFVLLSVDGSVHPVVEAPPTALVGGVDGVEPVFAAGEVRFAGAVVVVDAVTVDALEAAGLEEVGRLAGEGSCEGAADRWVSTKRLRPAAQEAHAALRLEIARAIADCWARSAEQPGADAPALLRRAHEWDHRSPELERVGDALAPGLLAEADRARADGDWELAYRRYHEVLGFQPWRAWARRWAEYTRDRRLGIHDDVMVGRHGGEDELRAVEEAQRAARQEQGR